MNKNLTNAKKAKNNEFYTRLSDIEKELSHYNFEGKIVYCNCDTEESNFVKYFKDNYDRLKLKGFYHTGMYADGTGDSFDSPKSIELLKQSDVVVSNSPFSLFRDYVDLLFKYEKEFLVIGNMNAITYKNIFKRIKNNKMWLGITAPKVFVEPNGNLKKFGNISWFTNLHHNKRNEKLILYKEYTEADYPKYDNYEAIEVSKTKEIPKDYFKVMGVPISFLTKYNPEQFEILGTQRWCKSKEVVDVYCGDKTAETDMKTLIAGKETYDRIFIKNKTKSTE